MLSDTRKLIDRIGTRVGWRKGEIRCRLLSRTYTARLQTTDRGAPVSIYTVSRELGHGSEEMVRRVYAHLGGVRHRAEHVGYRIGQHLERLGDRAQLVGFVTVIDTDESNKLGNTNPRHRVSEGGAEG